MRSWVPRGWTLVAVLVLAVIAAILIVTVARRGDDKKCVSVTVNAAATDSTPQDALALFIANQQDEGPLPLDLGTWTVSSQSGGETVFTSHTGGDWTVTVENGGVQRYSGCPS